MTFEAVRAHRGDAVALYDRIQAVEARSWKSREGVGISDGPDARVLRRDAAAAVRARAAADDLRAASASRDVGYILGAVMGGEYRGLQFSYDDDLAQLGHRRAAPVPPGRSSCAPKASARYDLGTEMDYKRRWAEEIMETEMLVLVR